MQLPRTIEEGGGMHPLQMSSARIVNSLMPEKMLQLFLVLLASSAYNRDAASDKNFFLAAS
jgi:hypothetical protein